LGYFRRALEAMAADDAAAVERIALLGADERRQVLETWNATQAQRPRECIHHLFEAQADRTPGAVAVVCGGEELSYAELNRRANRLAHHLRERGVGPDARVAICLERSAEMVVGVLAVLKAGGAYVPLDPAYPDQRLRYMLADSAPAVLLTQPALAGRFADAGVPVVASPSEWAGRPATNPERAGVGAEHLAYIIYTSGSTGRPKGTMLPHRGLTHYATWARSRYVPGAPLDFPLYSSFTFDLTVTSIFVPLISGGAIVVYGEEEGGGVPIHRVLAEDRVDVVKLTPSHLALLDGRHLRTRRVRTFIVGGEELRTDLAHAAAGAAGGETAIYNEYGPTEMSVGCTLHRYDPAMDRAAAVPIGRPVSNTRTYVLDRAGEPVPVGVTGELYVSGGGEARGYLDQPARTAERFVPDRFGGRAGARMYRTGDLARWRPDGRLEFLGRGDFQVKVRGHRIELGEIEARLAEHPSVRETIVLAREDAAGDRRLVAYVVGDGALEAEALRSYLRERLPEYLVPAACVRLDALPLTPNGKVDRKALPAPEGDAYAAHGYEAPAGEVESALAEIWSAVLRVDRVGRNDHFFELGGHSLLAVQAVSRVRQALGAEVALGELFARPVLADFARVVETAARAALPPIEPADRSGPLALSFSQQRLWFLEQLGSGGATYHVPARLRLRGALDRQALRRALDRIVARHEVLRTTFVFLHGEPVQRVAGVERSGFPLLDHDLRAHPDAGAELRRLMLEETAAPFDLERGPLVRGRLARLADDEHVLLVTMHHIVSDGWSIGVLVRELSALYAAFHGGRGDPLPPLPVQYADYAAWQRRRVDGVVLRAQAEYWQETLAGAPERLELPTDHPRPPLQDHAGAAIGVELDEALAEALKALGRRESVTLFMTLLAAWAVVLARLSGQRDVVVGTPTANRGRGEIEGLIGFFANTLALRVDLSGAPTVAELLARVKAAALGAQQHGDIPFEQVVERVRPSRSLAHAPLFQVMFAWQNTPEASLELPGLAVAPTGASLPVPAQFDLSLSLAETAGRIAGKVTYATALFERATAERHVGYLRRVLEAMAAGDGRAIDRLPLLPEAERRLVVEEWNRTVVADTDDACIHELFEAQAARDGGAVAVVHGERSLGYGELNARANRLAHHLRSLGVGPDTRVAVCMEQGPEMVVGLLAILKAGGAYVPLDLAYPPERLRYMLDDSAPVALLASGAPAEAWAASGVPVIDPASPEPAWAECPDVDPGRAGVGLTPAHAAYVIYTSGSTGHPKGVVNEHRCVVSQLRWARAAWGLEAHEAVLQRMPISFDVSVRELFLPLSVGARVVMVRPERRNDPDHLVETIRREGVGTLHSVPALLQLFLDHPEVETCTALQRVTCGGEVLAPALARRFHERLPHASLYHMYGPTETTVAVIGLRCPPEGEPGARIPLGRPVANTRIYILDGRGEPVPVGVPGEIHVAGGQVARGYLNRPALTAERFGVDPFSGAAGARMYRTGDLGRWRADGMVEYLGRDDFQVKLRGFRIEPGEIEARLVEYPAIRRAAVLAREDVPGDQRLVAYYEAAAATDAEALQEHLAGGLPGHMVPAAYVWMEALPLTPNGKVDRAALPAPDGGAYAGRGYEAPAGETEQALAEIWSELLGVEKVGRHDDFFRLGGHSLLATRLIVRVRQTMEVELALREVFQTPVLSALAETLLDRQLAGFDADELAELAESVSGYTE
ncbi:MAG TPA: amino acid adenylation domain-containing protein, partial [Longimicrobium sp.]|nr:amino acid adenylation domain-containing protein [Longimicrobium sp.]